MFAYCLNNPICRVDGDGRDSMDAVDLDGDPTFDEDEIQGGGGGFGGTTPGQSGPSITYLGGKMSPSSPGRLGGTLHRVIVDSLRYFFRAWGFEVSSKEERVYFEGKKYRYPDLILRDGEDVVAYVQVGKTTQSGDAVARERRAKADLEKTNIPVLFYAYDD